MIQYVGTCPKMILTIQIPGFFKLKYLTNELSYETDILYLDGHI